MTLIRRFDPFREYATLQSRMNHLFRDSQGPEGQETLTTTAFAPPVDVYEDEHGVTLKIDVPGIDEKDIDITRREQHADRPWRTQVREGRERRKLPSSGEPVRQLYPHLHAAHDGRP